MDANKVFYGLSDVHIAFIDPTSGDGDPIWDTPIPVPGAVNFAPAADNSEYKFYADNGVYYATYSDNGYTGTLEMARFPDAVLSEMFGWPIDQLGGMLETTDGQKRNFAIIAQVEGNAYGRRIVWYNCAGGKPTTTYQTNEDGVEVQTQSMDITIAPIKLQNGRRATKYHIDNDPTNDDTVEVYGNFFASVFAPTSADINGGM